MNAGRQSRRTALGVAAPSACWAWDSEKRRARTAGCKPKRIRRQRSEAVSSNEMTDRPSPLVPPSAGVSGFVVGPKLEFKALSLSWPAPEVPMPRPERMSPRGRRFWDGRHGQHSARQASVAGQGGGSQSPSPLRQDWVRVLLTRALEEVLRCRITSSSAESATSSSRRT